MDVIISNKKRILVEIKSSVSKAGVYEFQEISQLYEHIRGVKPKLSIVFPFVRGSQETDKRTSIDIYTGL